MVATLTLDVCKESLLELGDPGRVNFVQEATHSAVDDRDLTQKHIIVSYCWCYGATHLLGSSAADL